MHEDLRGINSVGVRIATAFSISTEKGFNGLIMNRITSPTANYKFLKGEAEGGAYSGGAKLVQLTSHTAASFRLQKGAAASRYR